MTDEKQSGNHERLRNAVLAIKSLRAQLESAEADLHEPIAVIGMGCRFPGGAIDPESYWRLLCEGRDAIGEIPSWRWPVQDFYSDDPEAPGKMYVRRGGFVDGIENFDADFFGISAREALRLDPQQRLMLEVSWEALEDCGIAPGNLIDSKTGIFLGLTSNEYSSVLRAAGGEYLDAYQLTGTPINFAAGRIAYFLGLRGPALTIDTACSSSLVSVDSACRSLRSRQCDLALAGGANALLIPESFVMMCKARMLSIDGRCKTFDATANGFVRGEGAGIVVLKRLADAQSAGDRMLAVILGSAVNQDGKSSGLTVPNRHAQEDVIRDALEFAGVAPAEIQYTEAHGTATPLGDPIEVRALANVLGQDRSAANPFYLGSVKTNIGHLESAAGIAGLLKVILALRHREIPAHLNLRNLTPHVEWDEIPVRVPTELTSWPEGAARRLAGVSSFGASGTNSHIVIGEAPESPARLAAHRRAPHLLVVSARTDAALRVAVERLAKFLSENPEAAIEDVCHTANAGRTHFAHRVSALCATTTEAYEKLRDCFSSPSPAGVMVSNGSGREQLPDSGGRSPKLSPIVPIGDDNWLKTLRNVQARYHAGAEIDWKELNFGHAGRKISLPTYPFERERFWVEPQRAAQSNLGRSRAEHAQNLHPLLGAALQSPAIKGSVFETYLDANNPAFLKDHRICGQAVLPAAAYVEMALAGGREVFGGRTCGVRELVLHEMMRLNAGKPTKVQIILRPAGTGGMEFEVYSASESAEKAELAWTRHAVGRVLAADTPEPADQGAADLGSARNRCTEVASIDAFYERLGALGVEFGPAFRNVRALFRGAGESLAEIGFVESFDSSDKRFRFHPALMDACFQAGAASVVSSFGDGASNEVLLPVGVESVSVTGDVPNVLWSHCRLRESAVANANTYVLDLAIFDSDGLTVASVSGLKLKRVRRSALGTNLRANTGDWLYEIQWRELPASGTLASESGGRLGQPGTWLILADSGGVGEELRRRMTELGQRCVLARPGSVFLARGDGEFELNPANRADFERLIGECRDAGRMALRGVVDLWSLDAAGCDGMSAHVLVRAQVLSCEGALHLVQAIVLSKIDAPKLHLVTRGTQSVTNSAAGVCAATAGLWGLGRVIAAEYPELNCQRIDLEASASNAKDDAELLLETLRDESSEEEIAFRGKGRFAPRLVRLASTNVTTNAKEQKPAPQPVHLEIAEPGVLENLSWAAMQRVAPASGEVEIEVRAAGLNFRDVLCALGMYQGKAGALGGECAGVVIRAGDGVKTLEPGDAVMALARGGFGTHVNVRAEYVAPLPSRMNFAEAAALPVVFLTTLYGLHRLARMKSGDRVLIHAAAGGVGLAAVQLAQRAGAEMFATAGSAEKRSYLRELGVTHIYDSRSLDFADEIMRDTGRRGVDIVLNSLAGDFIRKSVAVMAPGGRFLELGKRGILSRDEFVMLRPDCEYYAYDLGEEAGKDPSLIPELFAEFLAGIERGNLHPLPIRKFHASKVVDAFRYMAQAKHVGKIVISPVAEERASGGELQSSAAKFRAHSDATYVITGGFGGLGLEAARWLVREGARNLVLVGRSEPKAETRVVLDELKRLGAHVAVERCDVSDEVQLAAVFRKISDSMPPVRGIIHAAGTLDDGVLAEQSWDRFERVMAPKVNGAWNLHRLTLSSDLDFFVMFSSVAGIIGSAGQGNYAAGNTFMDGLAQQRQAMGLPALSVDWGTWGAAGMGARLEDKDAQRWSDRGLRAIELEKGMAKLGEMIGIARPQIVAMPVEWFRFLRASTMGRSATFFCEVAQEPQAKAGADEHTSGGNELVRRLLSEPAARRLPALQAHVESIARRALGVRAGKSLDPRRPLHDLGLDSLMAVELRNALAASIGRTLPASLLFDYPTVESVTLYLAQDILNLDVVRDAITRVDSPSEKDRSLNELQRLSESEAEALLLAELDKTKKVAND